MSELIHETFEMEVEYTDTFGGQANYSWVERHKLTLPVNISDRTIVRRAKALVYVAACTTAAICLSSGPTVAAL